MIRRSPPCPRLSRAAALLLLTLGLLAGCATMPTEGPVTEIEASGDGTETGPMHIVPLPPQEGQPPAAVVKGFLDAMQATPIQTNTARQFLTDRARAEWAPEAATITYRDISQPAGRDPVRVELEQAFRLDRRGAWQGALSEQDSQLGFRVVEEGGEYRIANPPDALIVPENWFEPRFQQASLYFFDRTDSVLVPEPVFAPTGPQLASSLVRRLLEGPDRVVADELRTMLPAGAREGLSVPVSDGLADIRLSREADSLLSANTQETRMLVAQLAWTLRQDPSVDRFRISVGDRTVQLEGRSDFHVTDEHYAPYVTEASARLYGLRQGRLVSGGTESLEPVGGPFGRGQRSLRSVAASLDAGWAAGVSNDGRRLLLAPVHDRQGEVLTVLGRAENLLRAGWDFAGRAWWVDRTDAGAVVGYIEGGQARTVEVPGISGRDVTDFLISRDGTRLIAVVQEQDGDVILASRIRHGSDGAVLEGTPAEQIGAVPGARVASMIWRTPIHVLVAARLNEDLVDLSTYTVDGSPSGPSGAPAAIRGATPELIGSPDPSDRTYVRQGERITELTGSRTEVRIPDEVTSLGYPG